MPAFVPQYAFCRKQRDFRLFRLGRILALIKTDEEFSKRPFSREQIPLNYWKTEKTVNARFTVDELAFADAQDWLGAENMRLKDGVWEAEVTLPDDETLVQKIVSFGAGIRVLEPAELAHRVRAQAQAVAALYD